MNYFALIIPSLERISIVDLSVSAVQVKCRQIITFYYSWKTMLRLTDIKLALNHQPEELKQAVLDKLLILDEELVEFTVFKRGYDARRKNNIILMYSLDVETTNDAAI